MPNQRLYTMAVSVRQDAKNGKEKGKGHNTMSLYEIPVTQYLRPDGRKIRVYVDRPRDIYNKAMEIIDMGYRFETEVLTTGHVSLTIADDEADHDIELTNNEPEAPNEAFDRLIIRFYDRKIKDGGGE